MNTDWKRKLLALLHDPPSKAVELHSHEQHAEILLRQAGFTDEEARRFGHEFAKPSDWTASATDRLPFPSGQAAGLKESATRDGAGSDHGFSREAGGWWRP